MNWSGQHCWVSTTLLSSTSLGICLLLLFQNTGTAERLQVLSLCSACAHYDCWFHSQAADDYFLILLRNIHAGLKARAKNTTGFQFSSLLLSSNFRCWKIMKELSCPVWMNEWMNECVQDILLSLVKITFITWHLPVCWVDKSKNDCFVKYGCWFGIKTDRFLDLAWSKRTIFFFLPFFSFPFTVY